MINTQQEASLLSGGDCFLHWHSQDRVATHSMLSDLISLEKTQFVVDGGTVVDPEADYVLVDTTAGNATLTLPQPVIGRKLVLLKTAAGNTATLSSPTGDINGAATLVLTAAYEAAVLKAIAGNYYRVA